jgi:hypothetical protein
MILTKFEDLFTPTYIIWKNLRYKDIGYKDKINYIINNKKLIHQFDDDIDNFLFNAINYYDNINLFVIFGKNKKDSYKYYEETFKTDYILYGLKYLKINSKNLYKMLYQLLFARFIIKTKKDITTYIQENLKYLYEYTREFIDITILIIRKRDINKKYPNIDINEKDDCVYIPNTKEQKINCSSLFLSNTSLNFMELQNLDYFLSKDYEPSKKMFLKYKKWLQNNVDYIDQQQFMLFSSIVLYLIGNRNINDLDLYIDNIPENLLVKVDQLKDKEEYNIDYSIKNTDSWPKHWNKWLDEWAKKSGAKYFEEILGNNQYHFHFLGIKVISLHCDIVRRIERKRPKAYADLIALYKRYPLKIQLQPIPSSYSNYFPLSDKSEDEIKDLLNKGGKIIEENDEISITYETNITKFINTIIDALHNRYKMSFTLDDIKRELNIVDERNINKISLYHDQQIGNSNRIKINIKKKI